MEKLNQLSSKYFFPSDPVSSKLGSINLNLGLLQFFGLPLFASRRESKASTLIYGIAMLAFIRIPYHLFEINDAILCLGNFNDLIQNITITFLHLGACLKTIWVFSRLEDFYKIVRQFRFMTEKYVKTSKQKEVFASLEFENKLSFTCYSALIGGSGLSGLIMVLMDPSTLLGQIFPYRAKMPDFVPFHVQTLYIPIAVIITGFQVVGIDYLNVTLINLTRCQLQVLNISFDELDEDVVGRITVDPVKHLNRLVEHHAYILSIRQQVESLFKFPMLVQFMVSLCIYALTGLQALIRSGTAGLVLVYLYVGCILAQLFGYCWFGNEVSEQSKTLAFRGYNTSWYKFDVKFRKSLVIFLINAQKPLYFTAGGYVELSLVTFSRILSKSYTFVAVLRQTYADK